ncbi:tetratricopeptide repeat protein [Trinickia terrae]|uniref:Tetratricopeptide repeat protein n=1 Tax=Trinickia terrae TaxID=2571161 RepID=A0A4U1I408_9BURK|nr:tetratricopeptide repeat protein [Trinickia terrae]
MLQPLLGSPAQNAADDFAEASNIAAVCALGLDRVADAEHHWRGAIAARPDFVEAFNNLGILLMRLGRLSEAEAIYRRLLAIRPDQAEAHNNLGAVLAGLRRLDEALTAYRQAIALNPGYAQAHYNLGLALYGARRLAKAEEAFRQALAAQPDCAEACNNLGNVLEAQGRLPEAEAAYSQAIEIRPRYPEALNNLGNLLVALDRHAEAELACRLAIAVRADCAEAHNSLGVVLAKLKRLPEAEAAYRQALAIRPDYAEAHYNLGIALRTLDRLSEAEAAYRQALAIRPDSVEALNNLGSVLQAFDRLPEAADVYRQAIAIREDLAEAHQNLGNVLKELGQHSGAEAAYRRAIAIRANYGDANFGLATLLLGTGRFEEGWRLYECRYEQPGFVHHQTREMLNCPQWQGEALAGKSLLVWQEDGLGDMIQFGRYLAPLKAQGAAHVALACAPSLRRLFGSLDCVDAVLDHNTALVRSPQYDCWTSLLSAPHRLGTTIDTIPDAVYLKPEPSLAESWRARLAALPAGLRIGLVWKGNPKHHNDANRSLPSLAVLAPLWSVPGVSFVSLQKGQGEDEAHDPPPGQPLLHLGSDATDFADTAAIVGELDLVISVDTSTAHMAASLGKPCWVLLPGQDVDWRWMRGRADSPWYPGTLRLFWQAAHETWPAVVERVRESLQSFQANDSADALASKKIHIT